MAKKEQEQPQEIKPLDGQIVLDDFAEAAKEVPEKEPYRITINTGAIDPRLNPNSPDFDLEAYKQAIEDAGGMEALTDQLKQRLTDTQTQLQGTIPQAIENMRALGDTAAEMRDFALSIVKGITDFIHSETYQTIKESISLIGTFLEQHQEEIGTLANLAAETQDLAPFLSIELEEMKNDPAYAGYTLHDLFERGFDADGNPTDSPFKQLIERAIKRKADFDAAEGAITEIEQAAAELPKLQSLVPVQHTMPNNTLMNDLAGATGKQPINAGAYDMTVIPAKKRQKEITTFVMADYEPEKGIVSNLSEYERDVSDAIMSIWEQAKREGKPAAFTTDSLYRAMPGRGERASPQQKGAITKAAEKFLHLWLDIDATEELRKRGIIGDGDTYHVKDYYLRAQEHVYKAKGGQPVRAWLITGEPLILNYAKMTGQLLTVPAQYLAIEKVKQGKISGELLTMNAQRQAMTSYMLRRIAVMKHDLKRAKDAMRNHERRRKKDSNLEYLPLSAFREQSDTILFDSLFKATGAENNSRELMRRNRDFCFSVLDYWKATGYIKNYSQQIKGRNITGIVIEH